MFCGLNYLQKLKKNPNLFYSIFWIYVKCVPKYFSCFFLMYNRSKICLGTTDLTNELDITH